MNPKIWTIDRPGPGTLSTMAAPHGGAYLYEAMQGLAQQGVTVLVSALSGEEVGARQLENEAAFAAQNGITFVWLPIADRTIAHVAEADELMAVLADLGGQLAGGAHVVCHCAYGIGRSSTLAAALMVAEGSTPDEAWYAITLARGFPVPDTQAQKDWVEALAR